MKIDFFLIVVWVQLFTLAEILKTIYLKEEFIFTVHKFYLNKSENIFFLKSNAKYTEESELTTFLNVDILNGVA